MKLTQFIQNCAKNRFDSFSGINHLRRLISIINAVSEWTVKHTYIQYVCTEFVLEYKFVTTTIQILREQKWKLTVNPNCSVKIYDENKHQMQIGRNQYMHQLRFVIIVFRITFEVFNYTWIENRIWHHEKIYVNSGYLTHISCVNFLIC